MNFDLKSLRPFIGTKNYNVSRAFYRDLGFKEVILSDTLSVFQTAQFSFYLQDHYEKAWVENTMLFLEVVDVEKEFSNLKALELKTKYPDIRIMPLKRETWGRVFYVIDPAGVLLHIGQFYPSPN
jgi:catechol 2,3-dioxygenase-like lactoylglutathione lyase family enzyme